VPQPQARALISRRFPCVVRGIEANIRRPQGCKTKMLFNRRTWLRARLAFCACLPVLAPAGGARAQAADSAVYPIHAEYDAENAKTVLYLNRVALDSGAYVSAVAVFSGREIAGDPDLGMVSLSFWFTTADAVAEADREAWLAIGSGEPARVGRAYALPPRRPFRQVLATAVPLATWRALAAAEPGAFTFGARTLQVPPALLAAIRAFTARMEPAPS
jgi:hypothetical protein